jgi:hypothetical protein
MRKMSALVGILFATSSALAQSVDHLTAAEISAAVTAKPGTGAIYIQDAGFLTPSLCEAQMPGEFIYTAAGWLNSLSSNAKSQYLSFEPKETDTRRLLTIISYGCANGTAAGPVCQSITRVALLSDTKGTTVVEALEQRPLPQSWQNGFGARAACSSLVSRFTMADVQKVRNSKGEFLIATFNGVQLLKDYTVKEKHLKKLGM